MNDILIISALRAECLYTIQQLDGAKIHRSPYIYISHFGQRKFYWLITGMGKRNVRWSLKYFLDRYKVSKILSMGVSGGVSTDLSFGDIVLQDSVSIIDPHKPLSTLSFSRDFTQEIMDIFDLKSIPYHIKHGLTVDHIISSQDVKKRLSRLSVALIDMESYHITQWLHSMEIPCVSIRFILDPYNESILDLSPFIRDNGNIRTWLLLIEILKKPGMMRDLYSIYQKMKVLKRKQLECLIHIMEGIN